MMISVTDAKGQLTELVRRAEAEEDVVPTRHGRETVRRVAVAPRPDLAERRRRRLAARASGAGRASAGPSAARSQDELYDQDGRPT